MDRDLIALRPLLALQHGVFSRQQALSAGLTPKAIEANLKARRWQRINDGVYAANTGQLTARARVWAGLLWAGPGAAISDITALRWLGFSGGDDSTVHVSVDHGRRVLPPPRIVLARRRRLDDFVRRDRVPAVLSFDDAAVHTASRLGASEGGLGLLADVCREGMTTPRRLRDALTMLPKLDGRKVLWAVLDDVAGGARSFLELNWLRKVEKAHGLPTPRRQVRGRTVRGNVWRDGVYDEFGVVLELDGRLGHDTAADRLADRIRDTVAAGDGLLTLRHGYGESVGTPCTTAVLVGRVLRARGWSGTTVACRPGCPAGQDAINGRQRAKAAPFEVWGNDDPPEGARLPHTSSAKLSGRTEGCSGRLVSG